MEIVIEASDLTEFVKDKWFLPITVRIEEFEDHADVFEEFASVTEPGSAEWAVQCLIKGIRPFAAFGGFPLNGRFSARNIGAMIGSKAAICSAMRKAYDWSNAWSEETRGQLVKIWGAEEVEEAIRIWKRFADRLHPEFEKVRKFSVNLAMRQTYFEDLEFQMGLSKGMSLIDELRKSIQKAVKAATKAQRDAVNRAGVYLFAIENWAIIEKEKEQLSWPKLAEEFQKQTQYSLPIDEETFKKILQRCGLRGVGKAGRRVEVRIETK
jgi:hypothetical protein